MTSEHEGFLKWSKQQGIQISGVNPARIAGRGLGVAASQDLKAGEELVFVPLSALLTSESVPEDFRRKLDGISVHGLLASFLAFGSRTRLLPYLPWRATWPSRKDFAQSMPLLWPQCVKPDAPFELDPPSSERKSFFPLPPAIGGNFTNARENAGCQGNQGLLKKQQDRLLKDWEAVFASSPRASYDDFVYYWLIVNTRSFYFELPNVKGYRRAADRMVLCPVADCFNHADQGCHVSFNSTGFYITSDRNYARGEEIYLSYGSHSNDFLLTEYGFILEDNKWDSLPLDGLFSSILPENARQDLEEAGYLDNYGLDREGVCHRTQVAIRTQTLRKEVWKRYVNDGGVETALEKSVANAFISQRILAPYELEARNALECFRDERSERLYIPRHIKSTLVGRWKQISLLVNQALQTSLSPG